MPARSTTLKDIKAARECIDDYIYYSPLAHSETLSQISSAQLYLKLENLQMTGSFKDRGAFNKVLQLDAAERALGVVTHRRVTMPRPWLIWRNGCAYLRRSRCPKTRR